MRARRGDERRRERGAGRGRGGVGDGRHPRGLDARRRGVAARIVGTALGAVLAATAASSCARHQIRDVPRDGTPENTVAWDTEMVCARRDAAAFGQMPLASATWRDLAMRADARPVDPEALRAIARLMRANRERYADSACTARRIAALEDSAARADGAAETP